MTHATSSAAMRTAISQLWTPMMRMSPPIHATNRKSAILGLAHPIRGGIRPRRLTTNDPMAPSSPKYSAACPARARTSGGGGDDPSTEDAAPVVQDGGLSRRRAEKGLVQREPARRVRGRDGRRVVAKSRVTGQRRVGRALDERHVPELHLAHRELFAPAHDDAVGGRIDPQHVPRPRVDEVAEPAALADRVERRAAVGPHLAARGIDHRARANMQPRRQIPRGLTTWDGASPLALRLVPDRPPELTPKLAHPAHFA